uniref:Uncharacterized protein LOC114327928 n=1 Tax=Diabrotica virgifera virgifera TaxID=50390 RepID=A0A6P7F9D2_DIAVI
MGQLRCNFWRGELEALPQLNAGHGCDSIKPTFVFDKPYKIETRQHRESNVANAYCIYTDGSKTKEGSGCGIYSRSLNLSIKWGMGKNASVVQTELAGISIAAKEIIGKGIAGKTIIICTDSRQALLTLNRPRVISGLVMD